MKLEMYGHYYRMFKGTGGVPTKVTVVGILGTITEDCAELAILV